MPRFETGRSAAADAARIVRNASAARVVHGALGNDDRAGQEAGGESDDESDDDVEEDEAARTEQLEAMRAAAAGGGDDAAPKKKKSSAQGLIKTANPNAANPNAKHMKASELGEGGPAPELTRREREEIEKQRAAAAYAKRHAEGKTDESAAPRRFLRAPSWPPRMYIQRRGRGASRKFRVAAAAAPRPPSLESSPRPLESSPRPRPWSHRRGPWNHRRGPVPGVIAAAPESSAGRFKTDMERLKAAKARREAVAATQSKDAEDAARQKALAEAEASMAKTSFFEADVGFGGTGRHSHLGLFQRTAPAVRRCRNHPKRSSPRREPGRRPAGRPSPRTSRSSTSARSRR